MNIARQKKVIKQIGRLLPPCWDCQEIHPSYICKDIGCNKLIAYLFTHDIIKTEQYTEYNQTD